MTRASSAWTQSLVNSKILKYLMNYIGLIPCSLEIFHFLEYIPKKHPLDQYPNFSIMPLNFEHYIKLFLLCKALRQNNFDKLARQQNN